jgi:hypothetical protein
MSSKVCQYATNDDKVLARLTLMSEKFPNWIAKIHYMGKEIH